MQSQQVMYAPAPQQGQGQQAQMVQPQPGQTIVIQTGDLHQARLATYDSYPFKVSIRLGIVLIIVGCLLIVLNAVGIGVTYEFSVAHIGHGIWGGVWHILTGVFGVWAGKTKKLCQILTFMIFAILAALMALVGLVMFAVAAGIANQQFQDGYHEWSGWSEKELKRRIAMNAIAAIVSGIAGVISIICAALCCSGICCGRPAAGFTVAQASSFGQPTQVMYVPGTAVQPGVAPGGPMQPMCGPAQPVATASAPMAGAPPDYTTTMQEKRPL